uniref:Uncharacterized protein n=2 Tax=Xenopus tropicalis TaxID=8364 RepID=A0A6I8RD92_XENTR
MLPYSREICSPKSRDDVIKHRSHWQTDRMADSLYPNLPYGPVQRREQFCWGRATNENSYSNKTLMGNWNQEHFDLSHLEKRKPLPSQYDHYYQSSYSSSYNKTKTGSLGFKREPHIFPGHQPELESLESKPLQKSCYMLDYCHPLHAPFEESEEKK